MYYPKVSEDKKLEIEQKKQSYVNHRIGGAAAGINTSANNSGVIRHLDKHGVGGISVNNSIDVSRMGQNSP